MTEPSRESAAPQDPTYPPLPATASAAWPYAPQRRAPKGLAVATIVVAIGLTALLVVSAVAAWPAAREFREAAELGRSTLDVFTVYDGLGLLLIPAMIAAYRSRPRMHPVVPDRARDHREPAGGAQLALTTAVSRRCATAETSRIATPTAAKPAPTSAGAR